MANPLDGLTEQQKAALLKKLDAESRRLIAAYLAVRKPLDPRIDALLMELELLGEKATVAQMRRSTRYQELMSALGNALVGYAGFVGTEIAVQGQTGSADGMAAAVDQLGLVGVQANTLAPELTAQLMAHLSPDGPLYTKLRQWAPVTFEGISKAILDGVRAGLNPRTIATSIQQQFGLGLVDSLRMVRTAQLYSYRYASQAVYAANASVVSGWQWKATLDSRTCAACISKHGSVHPVGELMRGHYNCRCLQVPVVAGRQFIEQSGEDWFDTRTEREQLAILGPGKYEAWRQGKFDFSQLATEHMDDVYGAMVTNQTLERLLQ